METIRVVMDGGAPIDVSVADPAHITAAELNAAMAEAGVNIARVTAVTPGHELMSRLQRLEYLEEDATSENSEAQDWRAWLDDLRIRGYDGLYRTGPDGRRHAVTWEALGRALPWPSWEDEQADAWEDD
jgi:hypothetical protein